MTNQELAAFAITLICLLALVCALCWFLGRRY